jgi:hypothetical protein
MAIGKFAGKAAGVAADAVGGVLGPGTYPETEYGLAAFLFDRIASKERDQDDKDRAYCFTLMGECLKVVRPPKDG